MRVFTLFLILLAFRVAAAEESVSISVDDAGQATIIIKLDAQSQTKIVKHQITLAKADKKDAARSKAECDLRKMIIAKAQETLNSACHATGLSDEAIEAERAKLKAEADKKVEAMKKLRPVGKLDLKD